MERKIVKLFVIGATGRTGREVVQQALARNHHVTAFVRSPASLTLKNERLRVLKGNAMDENQLFRAIQNHDAVLSTLGPREVFKPSSMLHDSAVATTRAMNRAGVRRLVVLSAAAHFPGLLNRIASFIMRNHMRDSLAMEAIVQAAVWTGRLPDLHASLKRTTSPTEPGKTPLPGWLLVCPAKQWRDSCSRRSNNKNISNKSWVLRNNL